MNISAQPLPPNIGDIGDFLAGSGTVVLAMFTAAAALIAAITYYRQRTDSQLHWFVDLQKRLCEQECFRSVRQQLYAGLYNSEESALIRATSSSSSSTTTWISWE